MAKTDLERPDPRVLRLLDGSSLDQKIGLALQLVSVDAQGAPHVALLSVGEVLSAGDRRMHLALYATSSTTANLRDEVPYAELTSGTTYRLVGDPAPVLERWGETLAQLRRL